MSWISETAIGSTPANGSSSSRIFGCVKSDRAISRRRRSPPDSTAACESFNRVSSSAPSSSSTRCELAPFCCMRQGLGDRDHVLVRRQPPEDRRLLGEITEPQPRAPEHRQLGDVVALRARTHALIGAQHAHGHLENGGFPGAVGAQEARRFRPAPPRIRRRSPPCRRRNDLTRWRA